MISSSSSANALGGRMGACLIGFASPVSIECLMTDIRQMLECLMTDILIYMNDIVENISSDASLFADNTSLIRPMDNQTDMDAINDDLNEISHWAAQWRITFNARKTVYMIVSKEVQRPPSVSLYLQGIPIERVKSHGYLGVWFTEVMSWGLHKEKAIEKC